MPIPVSSPLPWTSQQWLAPPLLQVLTLFPLVVYSIFLWFSLVVWLVSNNYVWYINNVHVYCWMIYSLIRLTWHHINSFTWYHINLWIFMISLVASGEVDDGMDFIEPKVCDRTVPQGERIQSWVIWKIKREAPRHGREVQGRGEEMGKGMLQYVKSKAIIVFFCFYKH